MDEKTSVLEHLKELRKRFLWAGGVYFIAVTACFSFAGRISAFLRALGGDLELVYINPAEALVTNMKISLIAGLFVALPFILYQVWGFVSPALYRHERRYLALVVLMSLTLFLLGSAFAYLVVLPFTIAFFQSFAGPGLTAMFSYDKYVSFIGTLTILFGLVFQLPLVVLFLAQVGLVTPAGLRRQRRLAILVIFIVAAVLTPPDVVSQVLMALPMIGLYETSIVLASMMVRRRSSKAEMEVEKSS
jgi:sec-independent protein translocase protein TatC